MQCGAQAFKCHGSEPDYFGGIVNACCGVLVGQVSRQQLSQAAQCWVTLPIFNALRIEQMHHAGCTLLSHMCMCADTAQQFAPHTHTPMAFAITCQLVA